VTCALKASLLAPLVHRFVLRALLARLEVLLVKAHALLVPLVAILTWMPQSHAANVMLVQSLPPRA